MIIYLLLAGALVALDQWVKNWVVHSIEIGETMFPNKVISLTQLHNEGAAWSILEGHMWFFYIITAIACVVILILLYTHLNDNKWFTVGLTFVLGGAIGNFIDRLRLGYVVDMFQVEFFNFPIFNVADTSLCLGVLCIFIYIMFDDKKE